MQSIAQLKILATAYQNAVDPVITETNQLLGYHKLYSLLTLHQQQHLHNGF